MPIINKRTKQPTLQDFEENKASSPYRTYLIALFLLAAISIGFFFYLKFTSNLKFDLFPSNRMVGNIIIPAEPRQGLLDIEIYRKSSELASLHKKDLHIFTASYQMLIESKNRNEINGNKDDSSKTQNALENNLHILKEKFSEYKEKSAGALEQILILYLDNPSTIKQQFQEEIDKARNKQSIESVRLLEIGMNAIENIQPAATPPKSYFINILDEQL
jgi:hypothetical protein